MIQKYKISFYFFVGVQSLDKFFDRFGISHVVSWVVCQLNTFKKEKLVFKYSYI